MPRRDAQRREGRPRNQHRPPSSNRPVRSLRAAACQKVPQGTQRPLRRMQDQAGRTPTCSGSKRATRLRMEAWRKGARRRRRRPEDPRTLKPRRTHDPLTRRGPLMEVAADSSVSRLREREEKSARRPTEQSATAPSSVVFRTPDIALRTPPVRGPASPPKWPASARWGVDRVGSSVA